MKTYKELVAKAKENLPKTQVTFPYNGTKVAGRKALELAKQSGEEIFDKPYRHHRGCAHHSMLFSGSAAFLGRVDKTPYLKALVAEIEKIRNEEPLIFSPDRKSFWTLRSFHAKAREAIAPWRNELSSRGFAYVCACWSIARGMRVEQVDYHAVEHVDRNGGSPSDRTLAVMKKIGLKVPLSALKVVHHQHGQHVEAI